MSPLTGTSPRFTRTGGVAIRGRIAGPDTGQDSTSSAVRQEVVDDAPYGNPKSMRQRCPTCGEDQELVANPRRLVLYALPELRSPLEIVDPFACSTCGQEISRTVRFVSTDRRVKLSELLRN